MLVRSSRSAHACMRFDDYTVAVSANSSVNRSTYSAGASGEPGMPSLVATADAHGKSNIAV